MSNNTMFRVFYYTPYPRNRKNFIPSTFVTKQQAQDWCYQNRHKYKTRLIIAAPDGTEEYGS